MLIIAHFFLYFDIEICTTYTTLKTHIVVLMWILVGINYLFFWLTILKDPGISPEIYEHFLRVKDIKNKLVMKIRKMEKYGHANIHYLMNLYNT